MKRSAYLDKYPIVYFHGRVLWRLAEHSPYLSQFGSAGDESSENIIVFSPEELQEIPK